MDKEAIKVFEFPERNISKPKFYDTFCVGCWGLFIGYVLAHYVLPLFLKHIGELIMSIVFAVIGVVMFKLYHKHKAAEKSYEALSTYCQELQYKYASKVLKDKQEEKKENE